MRRGMILLLAAVLLLDCVAYALYTEETKTGVKTEVDALGMILQEQNAGLYVLAVMEGSPAAHSGVQPGDTLLMADDAQLTAISSLENVMATITSARQRITLLVLRNETEIDLHLRLQ